jgi:AcrR family transcriptional regulator
VRRRQQILDTAVSVFGQYGYAGGSLRKIAEIVGISTPALIRHFGSKEGLFVAVLEHSDAANTRRTLEKGHGLEYLRRFAETVSDNVHHRGLVELLLTVAAEASDPEHPARPFMVKRYENVVAGLSAELRVAAEAGDIRVMTEAEVEAEARGLAALMDGLELQWLLNPDLDLVSLYAHHFGHLVARWQAGSSATGRTASR